MWARSALSSSCVCSSARQVSRDFFLSSAKALTAALGSALRRMASLSFSDMGRVVCYHLGMWDVLQLLWYMFFYVFAMVIVPSWIIWKVIDLFFPSDD